MKKILFIMLIILTVFGCKKKNASLNKIKITTTLFPLYDFAKEVGKDKVEASLLLPPGAEPHSFEPTPQDIVKINESSLFIYTGPEMEHWVSEILSSLKNNNLKIIDASNGIELLTRESHKEEDDNNHDEKDEDHHHGTKDPHIWLDLSMDQKIVKEISAVLSEIDPANKSFYENNADAYVKKLDSLDNAYKETIARCNKKVIMSGGHFAFGYLAKRYGLTHISPYENFSPDSEPSPQNIAELIDNIKQHDIKVLYYEELLESKIANAVSKETKAELLLLHGAHNLSKKEFEKKLTFIDIMENNLKALKKGLEYKE